MMHVGIAGEKTWRALAVAAWTVFLAVLVRPSAAAGPEGKPEATVFVLPVKGTIDQSMLYVFRRAFRDIERSRPDAVILELDTPGGRLKETREIIQWMRSLKRTTPVYAFVNPDAYSAGAILSLGTNAIFMSPAGSIGDAMPILINPLNGTVQQLPDELREKMISPTRALVRGLAQENGYNVEMAEAMVDPDREFILGPVSCPAGELLTLTAQEAVAPVPPDGKPLLARAIVESMDAVLAEIDLAGAKVTRFDEVGAERLARWITGLGPLLLAVALLGLFIEFKTPGFGVFGITGLVLLAIYFFGHYIAGLAGYEEALLVVLGLILLAVEVLVIPGFGIVGVLGIFLILVGGMMSLIPILPTGVPDLPGVAPVTWDEVLPTALWKMGLTLTLLTAGGWLVGRFLPNTSVYRRIILESALRPEDGFVVAAGKYDGYVGRTGVARTALRPAGTAAFGDERLDVVTSGDMIDRGAAIRIIRVEGNRIVVEAAPRPDEPV